MKRKNKQHPLEFRDIMIAFVNGFIAQQDKHVQARATYDAVVKVVIRVPKNWDAAAAITYLKDDYYDFALEASEDVKVVKLTGLILNGEEINLETGKIKYDKK